MQTEMITQNGVEIAVVISGTPLITDVQSALDLVMSVRYETGCCCMAIYKDAVSEDFSGFPPVLPGRFCKNTSTTG